MFSAFLHNLRSIFSRMGNLFSSYRQVINKLSTSYRQFRAVCFLRFCATCAVFCAKRTSYRQFKATLLLCTVLISILLTPFRKELTRSFPYWERTFRSFPGNERVVFTRSFIGTQHISFFKAKKKKEEVGFLEGKGKEKKERSTCHLHLWKVVQRFKVFWKKPLKKIAKKLPKNLQKNLTLEKKPYICNMQFEKNQINFPKQARVVFRSATRKTYLFQTAHWLAFGIFFNKKCLKKWKIKKQHKI